MGEILMVTLRWIVFFPLAFLISASGCGLALQLGNYMVGGWVLTSGLLLYSLGGLFPVISTTVGLQIVPKPTTSVKWTLLAPHIAVGTLLAMPVLVGLIFFSSSWEEFFLLKESDLALSHSLSNYWQLLLYDAGYLAGTVFVISKDVEEFIG